MSGGSAPNFSSDPGRIANRFCAGLSICTTRAPRTHRARSLSGVQMATFSTLLVLRRELRRRSERIIGFQLDHRPDDNAHSPRERLLERMELRDAARGRSRSRPCSRPTDRCGTTRSRDQGGDAEVRGPPPLEPCRSIELTTARVVRPRPRSCPGGRGRGARYCRKSS